MRSSALPNLCLAAALVLSLTACGAKPPVGTAVPGSPAPAAPAPSAEGAFRELTAVDNESCLVKLLGREGEDDGGYAVDVQVTNRREGPILATLRSAAVNGVQTDPAYSVEVPAGETVEQKLVLDDPALEQFGITGYTHIELDFLVVDGADLTARLGGGVPVHLYPEGADGAEDYVRDEEDDELIFENEDVRASVTSYVQDRKTGFATNIHLVNKTDRTLNYVVEDATLNGKACDPFFFVSVAPGKQRFTSIYWSPTFMRESKVDEFFLREVGVEEPDPVTEIQFRLRVYDENGWSRDDLVDERVLLLLPGKDGEKGAGETAAPDGSPPPAATSAG